MIPFAFIFLLEKRYKLTFFTIFLPILIYFLINFYHQLSLNDFNLIGILGSETAGLSWLGTFGVNLFPEKSFLQTWGNSIFKMTYLFVHFNFKILISILFLASIIFYISNYAKLDIQIKYLFIIFFIPSLIHMLIFRMWADSHSYWSYYFIVPIITAIILFLDTKQKKFLMTFTVLISLNFVIQIFFNSKTILEIKQKPLSNETVSFINKYSNYDYVSNDNSIGFGFGFRSRWIENKKFFNYNNCNFSNKDVLFIKRINNCVIEKETRKLEFYNWCYSEKNILE